VREEKIFKSMVLIVHGTAKKKTKNISPVSSNSKELLHFGIFNSVEILANSAKIV
jgi:hypothetical protein